MSALALALVPIATLHLPSETALPPTAMESAPVVTESSSTVLVWKYLLLPPPEPALASTAARADSTLS
ncbi:hypothetical protein D3C83_202790 [compost metagenome]